MRSESSADIKTEILNLMTFNLYGDPRSRYTY